MPSVRQRSARRFRLRRARPGFASSAESVRLRSLCPRAGSANRIVGWSARVLREGVQDIGQHQFLMLLLVIEADLEDAEHLARARSSSQFIEQLLDRGVDMRAIGGDLVRAGRVTRPRWGRAWRGPAAT